MEQKIVNNNIVVIYQEDITNLLSIDRIQAKINQIYAEKEPIPVINKFPGLVAIIVPQVQVTLVVENNKLTISDQNIAESSGKDNSKLMTFSRNVYDVIDKNCISFGFNYIIEVEDADGAARKAIKSKFFKPKLDNVIPSGSNLGSILPVISLERENKKITYKFENVIEGPASNDAELIRVSANYHFNDNLFDLDKLIVEYNEISEELTKYINSLLSV